MQVYYITVKTEQMLTALTLILLRNIAPAPKLFVSCIKVLPSGHCWILESRDGYSLHHLMATMINNAT